MSNQLFALPNGLQSGYLALSGVLANPTPSPSPSPTPTPSPCQFEPIDTAALAAEIATQVVAGIDLSQVCRFQPSPSPSPGGGSPAPSEGQIFPG